MDLDDFKSVVQEMATAPYSDDELQSLFAEIDIDSSGLITLDNLRQYGLHPGCRALQLRNTLQHNAAFL